MKFKILALVLVAVFLLFAGCAKKGEDTGTAGGASGGTGATTGGAGTSTGGTGTTSGGGAGTSGTTDVGNLFKIDTDKPEEGSGYNVPAPTG